MENLTFYCVKFLLMETSLSVSFSNLLMFHLKGRRYKFKIIAYIRVTHKSLKKKHLAWPLWLSG